MAEIQKGERVRYFPGTRQGRFLLAEVISDGIVEFGGTKCYRVRADDGTSDYVAATHVVALTDYQLGQRVKYAEHIRRRESRPGEFLGPNRIWSNNGGPGLEKPHAGGEGIIIGKRTLTNGNANWNYDEPTSYTSTESFTAYLIAYDLHRKPVHVLPEHITPLEAL